MAIVLLAIPLAAQDPEPHTLFASGVGFNQAASPRLNTWYVMGVRIGPGSYATSAVDFTQGRSSMRAGFEQVLFRIGGIVITTKGEAGMATTVFNLGSAFSGGGSVLVPVGRLTKIPGSYLIGSVTVLKTSVGSSNPRPIYRFGFGGTF